MLLVSATLVSPTAGLSVFSFGTLPPTELVSSTTLFKLAEIYPISPAVGDLLESALNDPPM